MKEEVHYPAFREARNMNQEELALQMGIKRTTISKIENGKFSMSIDYLRKFADHLGFTIVLQPNQS